MYALVTTWRIHESIRTAVERESLVRELLASGIEIVRRAGVIDVMMIEVQPNLLIAVSAFETLEEADAASDLMRQFIADRYADRLETVSRITGRAYDPPQIVGLDRLDSRMWREDADAMYANLVTWRLDPSIQSPESLGAHLQAVWESFRSLLLQAGLLDVLVVRTGEDTMLAIRLYADRAAADATYAEALAELSDDHIRKVEVIDRRDGRAFDVPQMLGSRD